MGQVDVLITRLDRAPGDETLIAGELGFVGISITNRSEQTCYMWVKLHVVGRMDGFATAILAKRFTCILPGMDTNNYGFGFEIPLNVRGPGAAFAEIRSWQGQVLDTDYEACEFLPAKIPQTTEDMEVSLKLWQDTLAEGEKVKADLRIRHGGSEQLEVAGVLSVGKSDTGHPLFMTDLGMWLYPPQDRTYRIPIRHREGMPKGTYDIDLKIWRAVDESLLVEETYPDAITFI